MSAIIVSIALMTSFALWVTVHGVLAFGLIRRSPLRWHLLWLLLPATAWLAPYWGARFGLKLRSAIWVALLVAYIVLLVVGSDWRDV